MVFVVLIQNYDNSGFMLLLFKVDGVRPSLSRSNQPQGNVLVEQMKVCERDGSFGRVTVLDEPTGKYDLFLSAHDLDGVPQWIVKDSYWKFDKGAIHFYLKKL